MSSFIMPGATRIFISYRRDDTAFLAGWLYDRLAEHFGQAHVFKDVDSIRLGDDFADVIAEAVGSCDALLAVIGAGWLTVTDGSGRRRLDDPGDLVRLEIEAALARNVLVIPVVAEGARLPGTGELPVSLRELARRQALELRPGRFHGDTRHLLDMLDEIVAGTSARQALAEGTEPAGQGGRRAAPLMRRPGRRTVIAGAGTALSAILIATVMYVASLPGSPTRPRGSTHIQGSPAASHTIAPGAQSGPAPTPTLALGRAASASASASASATDSYGSSGSIKIPLDLACKWAYPGQASGQVSGSGGSIACLGANGQVAGRFDGAKSLAAWCQDPVHTGSRQMANASLVSGEWACVPT